MLFRMLLGWYVGLSFCMCFRIVVVNGENCERFFDFGLFD